MRPMINRAGVVVLACVGVGVFAGLQTRAAQSTQHEQHEPHGQLGTVSFQTSCSPKVQAEFERGVAMLHSYWFGYAGKTFRGILEQDSACAMAYWGTAMDLLGNTLAAPPPAQAARAAWDALEKTRSIEIKTERERYWIDALRAYFRDYDKG